MSHTPDGKSAPTGYCTPEGERSPALSGGRTDLSALSAALESSPASSTSTTTKSRSRVSRIPPRRIALCGGGIQGVAHVGFMKALQKEGLLGHVKEVIGISVGSLFALLWILGYTVKQIEEIAVTFDFSVLQNINAESVFSFPTTFGLDNGERLESFIGSVLHQKGFSADVTFEDLHRTCPVHLRCFATELQTGMLRQFSTTATPKTSVRFALRASMSVPIFYTPVQEPGGAVLVDGAILNNLPLVFMTPAEIEETWCAYFTRDDSEGERLHPITSLTQLLKLLFESMIAMKSLPFVKKFRDRIVCIPVNVTNSLEFGQGENTRRELVKKAYDITMEFLFPKGKRAATTQRRFSAS
jgi:predicted acylesterase/phospholipase RssA